MAKKAPAARTSKQQAKKAAAKKSASNVVAKKSTAKAAVAKKPTAKKAPLLRAKTTKAPKKPAKDVVAKRTAKPVAKKFTRKSAPSDLFDFSEFPAESLQKQTLGLCLACVLDVFTRLMGLSAERAHSEVRKYTPSLEELSAETPVRPYIIWPASECPYCGAKVKWLAPLSVARIEGGKTTDAARRALIKKIGSSANFAVIEEKSSERDALYSWLAKTGASLDLDSPEWFIQAAFHWLGRRLPKVDWPEIFKPVRVIRRSRRLKGEDFELEGPRLFLAPLLFDEVLLIQYLLSRSHKAGGQTFEGRMTLLDLFQRLRGGGYLRRMGITTPNPSDALEQLVEMHGGEGRVKFYYFIDRREFLAKLAELKLARIPRSK